LTATFINEYLQCKYLGERDNFTGIKLDHKHKRGLQVSVPRAESVMLPVSIFEDRAVSVLEVVTKYLVENLGYNYHDAGVLLNRNERTLWTCHYRAKKKLGEALIVLHESSITIPAEILRDRAVSVLECISEYMKDKLGLNYHEIGELLARDERTIWTCYHRAKKKRGV